MKRFLKAAKWWSGLFALTPNRRHIWRLAFHWGDWCAPEGSAKEWVLKGQWVATAYFANSCSIVSKIAELLGESEDAAFYQDLHDRIVKAYRAVFTDGKGKLKKEFQTGYVLPLRFGMTKGEETSAMADNLVSLVRKAGNHLGTGFTGTPHLLFALSDTGHADVAYDLLMQDTCPSWLYEVKAGGTTIWERWDALRPDGSVNVSELSGTKAEEESNGGMVSFNHYAMGSVGDWLYKRIAGIEPKSGGYKTFNVEPIPGGGISWAKGSVITPYGRVSSEWRIDEGSFSIEVEVPVSTVCSVLLPNGERFELQSGRHKLSCPIAR
jgi:alpha-L-rhamnosidase